MKSCFLSEATFFAALSWAFKAAFLFGFLAEASFALIARIFLESSPLVNFLTFLVALANVIFALASLALMAAFFAGEAANNFYLSTATFYAAWNWTRNACFLTGFLAVAILASILATFFASNLAVTFWTFLVA